MSVASQRGAEACKAEEARGAPYEAIYLTRPDVLLWADVDLRSYCLHDELSSASGSGGGRVVYTNNCHPPFHTFMGPKGCPADFHYVMGSASARRFATITRHFGTYDYFTEHRTRQSPNMKNEYMEGFLRDVVGAEMRPDHVVAGRHEESLRKAAIFLHGLYDRWCGCVDDPDAWNYAGAEDAVTVDVGGEVVEEAARYAEQEL